MRALKSIVRGFFAIQAVVFLVIPVAAIFGDLGGHARFYLSNSPRAQTHHVGLAAVYGVVAAVLAIGCVYALAWWTTRKAVVANRGWAIAASIANIAQGALLLFAVHVAKGHTSFSAGDGFWWIGLGAGGIALFARRQEATAASAAPVARKPVSGDRTSVATRNAVTVLSCIAQLAAIFTWSRWAFHHDLLRTRGLVWVALVTVASILTTIIHECGHALIAWCFDMSLLSFKAGPFQWVKREGKWSFKLRLAGLLTPGGAVGAVSKDPDQPRWEEILMIFAGPLANLIVGIPAIYAVMHDDWLHYQQTWELVAFTASFCVIAAILNLVPFLSEEGGYSDGARILQIVTKSPLEDYHRTMSAIASTSTTDRRYRDLDVSAILRAANLFPNEYRGLHLHLCACHYFEDSNRLAEASAELASAESIYNNFAIDLPAPLHTVFIIGHAYLNRDAAAAHLWWDRMEAKGNERQNVDYWLARTALLWIEGDTKAAERAWSEANDLAQALPKFGAYEFDRYRCVLLRQALDERSVVVEAVSKPAPVPLTTPPPAKQDEAVSAPILPAWISPPALADKDVADAPPSVSPVVEAKHTPSASADPYSDSASMFARLSSLTTRPVEVPQPAAEPPKPTEQAKAELEPAAELNEQESQAKTISADPVKEAGEAKQESAFDPLARIQLPQERRLPDPLTPAGGVASPSLMWSATPSAPPLTGASTITPLAVDSWKSLPPLATPSFTPSATAAPSRGPSVPAAFARRPRVTGPVPEFSFSTQPAEDAPGAEPEEASESVVPDEVSEFAASESPVLATETAKPSLEEQSAVVETAEPPSAAVPAEIPQPVYEKTEAAQPSPSPAEEPSRFDPLAFIRAARLENISS